MVKNNSHTFRNVSKTHSTVWSAQKTSISTQINRKLFFIPPTLQIIKNYKFEPLSSLLLEQLDFESPLSNESTSMSTWWSIIKPRIFLITINNNAGFNGVFIYITKLPRTEFVCQKMVPELRGSGRALQEYLHSLHLLRPLPGFRSAAFSFL